MSCSHSIHVGRSVGVDTAKPACKAALPPKPAQAAVSRQQQTSAVFTLQHRESITITLCATGRLHQCICCRTGAGCQRGEGNGSSRRDSKDGTQAGSRVADGGAAGGGAGPCPETGRAGAQASAADLAQSGRTGRAAARNRKVKNQALFYYQSTNSLLCITPSSPHIHDWCVAGFCYKRGILRVAKKQSSMAKQQRNDACISAQKAPMPGANVHSHCTRGGGATYQFHVQGPWCDGAHIRASTRHSFAFKQRRQSRTASPTPEGRRSQPWQHVQRSDAARG